MLFWLLSACVSSPRPLVVVPPVDTGAVPLVGPQDGPGDCVLVDQVVHLQRSRSQLPVHAWSEGPARSISFIDGFGGGDEATAVVSLDDGREPVVVTQLQSDGRLRMAAFAHTPDGGTILAGPFDGALALDESAPQELEQGGMALIVTERSGDIAWARRLDGSVDLDNSAGIVRGGVLADGSIVVAHGEWGQVGLSRFSGTGELQWVRSLGGTELLQLHDLAVDADHITLVGEVGGKGTLELDGEPVLDPAGTEGLVLQLDAEGTLQWTTRITGVVAAATVVHPLEDGTLLVGGEVSGLATVGFGRPSARSVRSVRSADAWLTRLDRDGEVQWVEQVRAPGAAGVSLSRGVVPMGDHLLWMGLGLGRFSLGDPAVVTWDTEGSVVTFAALVSPSGEVACASRWLWESRRHALLAELVTPLDDDRASYVVALQDPIVAGPGTASETRVEPDSMDVVELVLRSP